RRRLALPALLPAARGMSPLTWLRHGPVLLVAAGVPLAILALADPQSPLFSQTVSYPGRRIAVMIDASNSMQTSFTAPGLNPLAATRPAFFTTVAAAERFVELRKKGQYRDLLALIEFGNQAYVITPFTSDYDNLLLSIALIGDPVEYSMFPDPGTVIAKALEQSIQIFQAFDFLEASGNLMVLFTDGEDTTSLSGRSSLDEVLGLAVQHRIPLYFVRTNYGKDFGEGSIPDAGWRAAVEKTGGRFYVARDEASLLAAIADIDRAATGAIEIRQYTSQQPRFLLFALGAAALWTMATAGKLCVPLFQRLP
ncbi:MAG: VWA domain-containing protein, partial [Acidobacteriota bacterium]